MQGEVKKLKKKLSKLTQDRGASLTTGKNSNKGPIKNKKGELIECFICKGNHFKKDCPKQQATETETTQSTPSGSGDGSQSGDGAKTAKLAGSGLTHEVDKKTTEAIKAKLATLPARENIADDAKHTVTVDGKVTAKYCRHHGKFVRGKRAHFTPECTLPDNKKFAYQPRAGGNMASVSPENTPSPSPAPPYDREISGPADSHLIQCGPRTYYDFSNMQRTYRSETNLAAVNEEDEEDTFGEWFHALSKEYGGH
jgi:hypothetical protein